MENLLDRCPDLTTLDVAVAHSMAARLDRVTGEGYAGQEWIAERARCSVRSVRRSMKKLSGRVFVFEPRPGTSTLYRVADLDTTPDTGVRGTPDTGVRLSGSSIQSGLSVCKFADSLTDLSSKQGFEQQSWTDRLVTWNRMFPEFWARYPRNVGKKRARRVWSRVGERYLRRDTSPGDLWNYVLVLLDHYERKEFRQRDAEMVPHPAKWLDAEEFSLARATEVCQ